MLMEIEYLVLRHIWLLNRDKIIMYSRAICDKKKLKFILLKLMYSKISTLIAARRSFNLYSIDFSRYQKPFVKCFVFVEYFFWCQFIHGHHLWQSATNPEDNGFFLRLLVWNWKFLTIWISKIALSLTKVLV